jgi:hypothetical protein
MKNTKYIKATPRRIPSPQRVAGFNDARSMKQFPREYDSWTNAQQNNYERARQLCVILAAMVNRHPTEIFTDYVKRHYSDVFNSLDSHLQDFYTLFASK